MNKEQLQKELESISMNISIENANNANNCIHEFIMQNASSLNQDTLNSIEDNQEKLRGLTDGKLYYDNKFVFRKIYYAAISEIRMRLKSLT